MAVVASATALSIAPTSSVSVPVLMISRSSPGNGGDEAAATGPAGAAAGPARAGPIGSVPTARIPVALAGDIPIGARLAAAHGGADGREDPADLRCP